MYCRWRNYSTMYCLITVHSGVFWDRPEPDIPPLPLVHGDDSQDDPGRASPVCPPRPWLPPLLRCGRRGKIPTPRPQEAGLRRVPRRRNEWECTCHAHQRDTDRECCRWKFYNHVKTTGTCTAIDCYEFSIFLVSTPVLSKYMYTCRCRAFSCVKCDWIVYRFLIIPHVSSLVQS